MPLVQMLSVVAGARAGVLGFECEGDVILLVRLQFVRRQLQSLNVGSLPQLESDWLVLGPASRHHGALQTGAPADLRQDGLAGDPAGPQPPPGLAGAGNPGVGVGRVVTPVARVSAPAGISGATHHSASSTSCTDNIC